MTSITCLQINQLKVKANNKLILKGIDLTLPCGQVHALMGPNGSGKSTLGMCLMGHPDYQVVSGTAKFLGQDLLKLTPDQRARAGVFLAFQHPRAVAGVPLINLLRLAYQQRFPDHKLSKSATDFWQHVVQLAKRLELDPKFLKQPVNQALSGGEKKKTETLQFLLLKPKLLILDELDTGTDVDSLRLIGQQVAELKKSDQPPAVLLITHYQRIFNYLTPDQVHVIKQGKIVASGTAELVSQIEQGGYQQFGA